jgi:hypothetical protein
MKLVVNAVMGAMMASFAEGMSLADQVTLMLRGNSGGGSGSGSNSNSRNSKSKCWRGGGAPGGLIDMWNAHQGCV